MIYLIFMQVNGVKPITIRGRWLSDSDCVIKCVLRNAHEVKVANAKDTEADSRFITQTLLWNTLADFQDYNNPLADGALIKAALVHMGFVSLDTEFTASAELEARSENMEKGKSRELLAQLKAFGSNVEGLELQITSCLPPGSGKMK